MEINEEDRLPSALGTEAFPETRGGLCLPQGARPSEVQQRDGGTVSQPLFRGFFQIRTSFLELIGYTVGIPETQFVCKCENKIPEPNVNDQKPASVLDGPC